MAFAHANHGRKSTIVIGAILQDIRSNRVERDIQDISLETLRELVANNTLIGLPVGHEHTVDSDGAIVSFGEIIAVKLFCRALVGAIRLWHNTEEQVRSGRKDIVDMIKRDQANCLSISFTVNSMTGITMREVSIVQHPGFRATRIYAFLDGSVDLARVHKELEDRCYTVTASSSTVPGTLCVCVCVCTVNIWVRCKRTVQILPIRFYFLGFGQAITTVGASPLCS